MSKDRTKREEYDLIKEIIEDENQFDIFEILRKENISFFQFYDFYRRFLLTTYLAKDLPKKQRRRVSLYLVKKGVYKTECGARASYYTLKRRGLSLNLSCQSFREDTYKKAIDKMSDLKKEYDLIDSSLHLFCVNKNTYSEDFVDFCQKYNLTPATERSKKRKLYKIVAPKIKKIIPEKKIIEIKKPVPEIKKGQKLVFTFLDLKQRIKFLKKIQINHFKGKIYILESLCELNKLGCLDYGNIYNSIKVSDKIQELQNSIQ